MTVKDDILKTFAIYCNGFPARQLGFSVGSVKATDKKAALAEFGKYCADMKSVTAKLVR